MRMKKSLILIIAALTLFSCSSVDLEPADRYDISYAFSSTTNAERYLNYFYKEIYQFSQFGSCALGGSNSNMSDGLTDILKYGAWVAGSGDCNMIMTVDGRQSVSSNYFDSWTTCYGWIRRINEYLGGLKENRSNFPTEVADRLEAEARFWRAWSYFLILRSHASAKDDLGAVIYLDIKSMNAEGKDRARSSLADSWNAVENDLDFAIGHLPAPTDARGRLNVYVAYALKARAMLYAGRFPAAKAAAAAVFEGPYGYEEDYDAIFASLSSKEAIWGYAFLSGVLTHSFDSKYSQPGDTCVHGNYGGGLAGPTQEFVDMYDNADGTPFDITDASRRFITPANVGSRDPRLAKSVLYNQAEWKGRKVECYEGGVDMHYWEYQSVNAPGNTVTGYYMRKLLDEKNRDFLNDGSYQPWIEFRYAEMKLIYAECCAREDDFTSAFNTLNELRKVRFGRDDVYTPPITSLETALDAILKERAVELCFEGHRFWDLRRTGRARAVLDGKKYNGVLWHKTSTGFTPELISCDKGARKYPERFDRFPVPQTEINNNTLMVQNSDW